MRSWLGEHSPTFAKTILCRALVDTELAACAFGAALETDGVDGQRRIEARLELSRCVLNVVAKNGDFGGDVDLGDEIEIRELFTGPDVAGGVESNGAVR